MDKALKPVPGAKVIRCPECGASLMGDGTLVHRGSDFHTYVPPKVMTNAISGPQTATPRGVR